MKTKANIEDADLALCVCCGFIGTGAELTAPTGGDDFMGQCPECGNSELPNRVAGDPFPDVTSISPDALSAIVRSTGCCHNPSLDEALNSGDGSYRP